MSVIDKLSLGLSTTLIGMGIVFFVLIALWGIIVLEHKIIEFSGIGARKPEISPPYEAVQPALGGSHIEKSGRAEGSAEFIGIDNEAASIIIAAVTEETEIPINELYIKSIRKIDK